MTTRGAEQPARSSPDPGRIIFRSPRFDGTELRVSLHRFGGDASRPFVRVGLWQSARDDAWPVKGKGVTVKVRELDAVGAALVECLAAASADGATATAPRGGR